VKYKAFLEYYYEFDDLLYNKGRSIPIISFSVEGGANRKINLASSSDISITSELEQARSYKNITLFMPPTKNHLDMLAAVELTDIALNKPADFGISFSVEKRLGSNRLERLSLSAENPALIKRPTVIAGHLLMIEVSLPDAFLELGKWQKGKGWQLEEM
jgi:hypothetical protein